jgi:membrane associated rhomboid family serine protease
MLIPLATDQRSRRRSFINEALVVLNLLVYLAGVAGAWFGWWAGDALARHGHFDLHEFKAWQLVTYQFIHDPYGLGHIIFNLIFLWVFGNAVESRLGHLGYLGFYLMGGAVAALAHGAISEAPVIGASGSISAVTGAFLALFPGARIRAFFILTMSVIEISAAWLILLYFAIDLLNEVAGLLGAALGNVAYAAHLAGSVYGFLLGFSLLGLGILPREESDVFFLFKQLRRRRAFRALNRKTASASWVQPKADTPEQLARRKPAKPLSESERALADQRAEILRLLSEGEALRAAAKYRTLLALDGRAVFPEQRQLDLANQFFAEEDFRHAKQSYELFLEKFPSSRSVDHVRLILALIYTRKALNEPRARELLDGLAIRLTSETERALAAELIVELGA